MHRKNETRESLAQSLLSLRANSSASVFYDRMSGVLVWTDEKLMDLSAEQLGCLKALFRYRTGLITGEWDMRFRELWRAARQEFPA